MIRFQCPHCQGIVAAEEWEPGSATMCAYCAKEVKMPEERLSPGAVLGDFLLVRKLGAGGMGVVFLAHQLSLDRPAAIKVLNAEFSQEAESVQAFVREARSAAKINHPNIVQAYAVGEEDGIFYFAMEFLDGKTMKEELQEKGKIDSKKAAEIIMQVAEALDCAWREQKLIHHDIKPDNIMQCANDRVKLADLGLSGTFGDDADDDSDEVVGTPQYISPEQLTGVVTDTRSDIYSLGATFYHLVTGEFPYKGENTEEIAKQHVYGTLTPPKNIVPQLPQELNDIIVKMMKKKPEERFQNCAELAKKLKDFLSGSSTGNASAPKLGGGLSGNQPAKLGGGLSGNQPAKLGGGLTGGGTMTVQPRIQVPSSPVKIGIKTDEPAKAEEPKQPETPAPAAAPAIKLGVAPSQEKAPETTAEAAAPAESDAKTETSTPAAPAAPKITLNRPAPAAVPAKAPEAAPAAAPAADENKTDAPAENAENKSAEPQLDAPGNDGKVNEEAAENQADKKPRKSGLWWLWLLIVLLLAGGGAAGWFFLNKPKVEEPPKVEKSNDPYAGMTMAERMVAANNNKPVPVEEKTEENVPMPSISQLPKAPVLSAFMRKAKQVEQLSLSNERSFVSSWPSTYPTLKPADDEEKKFLESLESAYVDADERINIEPKRKALLDKYNAAVAAKLKREENMERNARIKAVEDKAFKLAESSAENYRKDLPRKMSILDHAMISAARNPRLMPVFKKALAMAKAEPARIAGREGCAEAAQALADYADRLEIVVEQGSNFTEVLKKRTLRGKKVSGPLATITVNNTSIAQLVLVVLETPQDEPAQLKPKAPAKKGKGKAKGKAKTKPKPKAKPKSKVEKIDLLKGNVVEVKNWVESIEPLLGRRDQYFYFMLYNGYLSQDLSPIAPDDFWKKRVDKVAKGYYKRMLLLAAPAQLTQFKKQFAKDKNFQTALKEFEAEQY